MDTSIAKEYATMGYMRIGIDARMYGPQQTGIGIYIKNIIERVPAADPENEYVIFLRDPFFESWTPASPNVTKVRAPYHWYSYDEQFLFPLQLYRAKLDLVHFPNFNVPLLYRKPYVVTIHDTTPLFFHGHRMTSSWRRMAFDTVFAQGIHKAKKVIAVSEATKRDIMSNIGEKEEHIRAIPLGYDPRLNELAKYDTMGTVFDRFKITAPYLLYAGVWRNHKNIVGLIEAFALARQQSAEDLRLVLVGTEHEHYPEPRLTWERLGIGEYISRPGFVSDAELAALYAHARAYVVPSFSEGFGINGLEAMSFSVPVIAARAGSLPEVYGAAAHYFDPHEPTDMARAITDVFTDDQLRAQLIERGTYLVRSSTWEFPIVEHIALYRQTTAHAKNKKIKEENNATKKDRV